MKNLFLLSSVLLSLAPISVQADSGMQSMIDELGSRVCKNGVDKLYQKRLLTLLPLIQTSYNPDITTKETKGNTALHYACGLSHLELVQWLIAHGADVDACTDKGANPDACVSGKNAAAITALLRQARAEKLARIEAEFAAYQRLLVDYAGAVHCARGLERLFADVYDSERYYSAEDKAEHARLYAEKLYHYVQTTGRLPYGVHEKSVAGSMFLYAHRHGFSAQQMEQWAIAELRGEGENQLDDILEGLSFFADALLEIPGIADDVTEVVVTFDPTGQTAPDVRVERRKVKTCMPPYTLKLHFCGRVSLKDGAEATVLLGQEYAHVDIAEPEARFDADLARHFGKHCRLVSYFVGDSCLPLYYTPEGEINTQRTPEETVPQSAHVFPIYFKVAQP